MKLFINIGTRVLRCIVKKSGKKLIVRKNLGKGGHKSRLEIQLVWLSGLSASLLTKGSLV